MNGWSLNPAGQPLRRYAGDGFLAGGVDGQHDHCVRVGKCAAELVQQIPGPRVTVGLKDDEDALVSAFAGGGQGSANLRGMVTVVVYHGHAARLTAQLEAPVNTAKAAQPFG